jgi:hypothetical protein
MFNFRWSLHCMQIGAVTRLSLIATFTFFPVFDAGNRE